MLKVVKIGGNIVDNPEKLERFLADFASLEGPKILVHGGGKVATTISRALGVEARMIDGRRVTDEQTLRIVTMVYAGVINKSIVAALQSHGCNAVGLSGADGRFVLSRRRSPVPVDYGFVGDPTGVNVELARALFDRGATIVVAPITFDPTDGSLLNTNADTVASAIAVAMSASGPTELVYCFEKRGVLGDVEDEDSVIQCIDKVLYESLKASGAIFEGMLPKLDNAFRAIDLGVSSVVICSAENIASQGYGGTRITL
ncbi:MAG: acetylglutamate kinase [Rikenellaceae bacterium]|jgi:acetylglutamate kinase|nr:acetylglutamate kinase [Rikenellaceae bacterium]